MYYGYICYLHVNVCVLKKLQESVKCPFSFCVTGFETVCLVVKLLTHKTSYVTCLCVGESIKAKIKILYVWPNVTD